MKLYKIKAKLNKLPVGKKEYNVGVISLNYKPMVVKGETDTLMSTILHTEDELNYAVELIKREGFFDIEIIPSKNRKKRTYKPRETKKLL